MVNIILKIDGTTYEVEDENAVFRKIMNVYLNDCEVVLGELLASIYIEGLSLDQTEDLIKRLRHEIDGGYGQIGE